VFRRGCHEGGNGRSRGRRVWLCTYFDGLELAAAAGAVRKAAEPLDEERVTGKGAGSLKIAAALRASAQDGMASNGLALLVGNFENEIACSVFTDQVTSHSRQASSIEEWFASSGFFFTAQTVSLLAITASQTQNEPTSRVMYI
jgi:hypothetical protein